METSIVSDMALGDAGLCLIVKNTFLDVVEKPDGDSGEASPGRRRCKSADSLRQERCDVLTAGTATISVALPAFIDDSQEQAEANDDKDSPWPLPTACFPAQGHEPCAAAASADDKLYRTTFVGVDSGVHIDDFKVVDTAEQVDDVNAFSVGSAGSSVETQGFTVADAADHYGQAYWNSGADPRGCPAVASQLQAVSFKVMVNQQGNAICPQDCNGFKAFACANAAHHVNIDTDVFMSPRASGQSEVGFHQVARLEGQDFARSDANRGTSLFAPCGFPVGLIDVTPPSATGWSPTTPTVSASFTMAQSPGLTGYCDGGNAVNQMMFGTNGSGVAQLPGQSWFGSEGSAVTQLPDKFNYGSEGSSIEWASHWENLVLTPAASDDFDTMAFAKVSSAASTTESLEHTGSGSEASPVAKASDQMAYGIEKSGAAQLTDRLAFNSEGSTVDWASQSEAVMFTQATSDDFETGKVVRDGSASGVPVGSIGHAIGKCRPCAHYWKPAGCSKGDDCERCHLCDQNAFKRCRDEYRTLVRKGQLPRKRRADWKHRQTPSMF